MRVLVIFTMIIVNIILESTLFQYFRIFGVKPDFTLILIVAYSILQGGYYSTFIGLVAGLITDIVFGNAIGVYAFCYMITGYVIGQVHGNVFKDSVVPAILFNIIAVFIFNNLFFYVSYFMKINVSYTYMLIKILIPQCIYNGLLGFIVYKYLYKLDISNFMQRRIY